MLLVGSFRAALNHPCPSAAEPAAADPGSTERRLSTLESTVTDLAAKLQAQQDSSELLGRKVASHSAALRGGAAAGKKGEDGKWKKGYYEVRCAIFVSCCLFDYTVVMADV